MNTLLWFQRDLRITDNAALDFAISLSKPITAIYIHSPDEDAPWTAGAASNWWLHHSLQQLSEKLATLNIKLQFIKADSVTAIPEIVNQAYIGTVIWTNRHEPKRIECENKLDTILNDKNITVKRFKDELLSRPNEFLTASKATPYRVFTPFYKKLRSELDLDRLGVYTTNKPFINKVPTVELSDNLKLEQLELLDENLWHQKLHSHWSPGEESALHKLENFTNERLTDYILKRDFPATQGTSGLSPHLHFGEISPRQIVTALAPLIHYEGGEIATAAEAFLRQLIWREFARYILWHFPETASEPMNKKYSNIFWNNDEKLFKKWQQGKSGIPIVDAGMRELWETGIMHNRVRMLAASLLTKNMGLNWQLGARWFWDTLIDADLANNSMGWQWVAGCGVDAAPYFRIFNPNTQAVKFDKQQHYIQRWQQKHSPTLQPVVDLSISRNDALYRYKKFIKSQPDQVS